VLNPCLPFSRSYAPAQERSDGSPPELALAAVADRETGNEPANSTLFAAGLLTSRAAQTDHRLNLR